METRTTGFRSSDSNQSFPGKEKDAGPCVSLCNTLMGVGGSSVPGPNTSECCWRAGGGIDYFGPSEQYKRSHIAGSS